MDLQNHKPFKQREKHGRLSYTSSLESPHNSWKGNVFRLQLGDTVNTSGSSVHPIMQIFHVKHGMR